MDCYSCGNPINTYSEMADLSNTGNMFVARHRKCANNKIKLKPAPATQVKLVAPKKTITLGDLPIGPQPQLKQFDVIPKGWTPCMVCVGRGKNCVTCHTVGFIPPAQEPEGTPADQYGMYWITFWERQVKTKCVFVHRFYKIRKLIENKLKDWDEVSITEEGELPLLRIHCPRYIAFDLFRERNLLGIHMLTITRSKALKYVTEYVPGSPYDGVLDIGEEEGDQ